MKAPCDNCCACLKEPEEDRRACVKEPGEDCRDGVLLAEIFLGADDLPAGGCMKAPTEDRRGGLVGRFSENFCMIGCGSC